MSPSGTGGSARLRVGLVGCGDILPEHTAAWSRIPGCEMKGFFDLDPQRSARAAAGVPGAAACGTLDELIAGCDLVDVCSPPEAHREAVLRAIDAGRHVLIEKPVVVAVADWEEIRARAAGAGVKIGAVHQLKHGTHVLRAKRWLDEGRIGDLLGVSCEFLVDPDSDPWLTLRDHWVNALPGARWFEVLPHLLYLVHQFTGRLTVDGVAVLRGPRAPSAAPADGVMATLLGASCLVEIHLAAGSRLDRRTIVLRGAKGTIEIAILRGVSTCTSLVRVRESRPAGWIGVPFVEAASTLAQWVPDRARFFASRFFEPSLHTKLIDGFVRHVREDAPSPTPADEIDSVVRACAALGERIEQRLGR
ncbi:MAG TPA: Gfo/Idh/MocA family oxidoreductase [Candidatus Polarisedimenticolia bacterium]|nr:Gfo/Idh/MocA family oxidoreductase [Candidatus Polarisedimenticolia bacterium]